MDIKTQLNEVNEAISAVLKGGQSYKIGSRSLSRADLAALMNLKSNLEQQLAEESTQNGLMERTTVAVFDRR